VQARYRGGGRSPRGARGCRDPPRRQFRDRAEACRRPGLYRPGRPRRTAHPRKRRARRSRPARPDRLFRKVRLPGQRLHHRRDRAAAVQLQRSPGR
ncbi:hypothetical protein LTR94_036682, partial [Friedmanniomyces endolithicus]